MPSTSTRRRQRLLGTEPPKHGTSSGYKVYGCHCELCLNHNREKQRKALAKYRKREHKPHCGTYRGYSNEGCRCQGCLAAFNLWRAKFKGQTSPTHGIYGYQFYGCRCEICKAAARTNFQRINYNKMLEITRWQDDGGR